MIIAVALGAVLYIGATRWRSMSLAEVEVQQGYSVARIAGELAKQGVIRMPKLFEIMVRVKGVQKKLRAGTYEFPAGTTLMSALDKLGRGEVKQYPLTVVEGWTIKDIAKALGNQPYLASPTVPADFIRLSSDKDFISKLGLADLNSLEGYLFPDTYFLTKPVIAEVLIRRMVEHFRGVWGGLDAEAIKNSGLTEQQILTLASIVEKEAGAKEERALVASVFLNRLKKDMLLQSDPTIIYGLPNYDGNIRKKDILDPHAYNTYVHAGLPPGPICNPGRASIEGVIHPTASNFLFFVSKNDGTHVFTENLSEHTKMVNLYQRGR